MFDAETKSLWSTLEGRPVVTTTWKEWRSALPETTVLALDTGHRRDYDEGVAYRSYVSHDDLRFEVPGQDKRLKRKAEVGTFLAGDDPSLSLLRGPGRTTWRSPPKAGRTGFIERERTLRQLVGRRRS